MRHMNLCQEKAAVLSLEVLNELSFSIPNFLDPLGGHAYYYFCVPVIFICGSIHMICLWSIIADRNMKDLLRPWNQMLLLTQDDHNVPLLEPSCYFVCRQLRRVFLLWGTSWHHGGVTGPLCEAGQFIFLPELETWETGEEKFCFFSLKHMFYDPTFICEGKN